MNIESKRYRIRTMHGIGHTISDKLARSEHLVRDRCVPSSVALAMMTESEFNQTMADLIDD